MSSQPATTVDPIEEVDELIRPADAPNDPVLGLFFPTNISAESACKRRKLNGLSEAGAVLIVNGKAFMHRRNVAIWALSKRK